MSAVGTLIACLASLAVGVALCALLAQFDNYKSPAWRHRAGSAALWCVALSPFLLSMPSGVLPDGKDLALSGLVGHLLPEALQAQEWMTSIARVALLVWIAWAGIGIARLWRRLRLTLRMAAELRQANPGSASAIAANVPVPMLIGLRRPLVLLPRASLAMDPSVLLAVEGHERAHAARRDNWRLLAEQLVILALPWCIPLRKLHEYVLAAREEICDALALEHADEEIRHAYARVLVDTLRRAHAAASSGTSTMGGPLATASRRIGAILQEGPSDPSMPGRQRMLAIVLALSCAGVLLVTPGLKSEAETVAGLHGLSLRFEPLPGAPGGNYRVTALGGTSKAAQGSVVPGNYQATFIRDAQGRWVVRTVPAASTR